MRERGMIENEFKEKGKVKGSKGVREKGGKSKGQGVQRVKEKKGRCKTKV